MEYKSSFGVRTVFVEFAEIAILAFSVFSTINSKSFLIMETEVEVKLKIFPKRLFAKNGNRNNSVHYHEILPFIRWVRFSTLFQDFGVFGVRMKLI